MTISGTSRLNHILDRIDRIQYAETILLESENEEDLWEEAQVAFDAILYDLVVIGEAVKALSPGIKKKYSMIPWGQIAGMRDILAHEYFRVEGKVVRATIDKPLQELKLVCERALREIK
jgi:uncharacterized protein with HEPN domain